MFGSRMRLITIIIVLFGNAIYAVLKILQQKQKEQAKKEKQAIKAAQKAHKQERKEAREDVYLARKDRINERKDEIKLKSLDKQADRKERIADSKADLDAHVNEKLVDAKTDAAIERTKAVSSATTKLATQAIEDVGNVTGVLHNVADGLNRGSKALTDKAVNAISDNKEKLNEYDVTPVASLTEDEIYAKAAKVGIKTDGLNRDQVVEKVLSRVPQAALDEMPASMSDYDKALQVLATF